MGFYGVREAMEALGEGLPVKGIDNAIYQRNPYQVYYLGRLLLHYFINKI